MIPVALSNILKIENRSSNLQEEFLKKAKHLFGNFIVVKDGKTKYRFTELEFYFLSKFHNDVYIYCKPRQLTSGKWFRHGAGIDLTFGNEASNFHGGILIRGLWDITNERYINGCWNVLIELSGGNTRISSEDLDSNISIEEGSHDIDYVLTSTRVGLNKKESDEDNYIARNYRFITDINPKNKFREKTIVANATLERKLYDKDTLNTKIFKYKIVK